MGCRATTWRAVTRAEPCPICGGPDNCKVSGDGGAIWCGRIDSGGRQNAGGQWLHMLGDEPAALLPVAVASSPEPASVETRNRVYRSLLQRLSLRRVHWDDLQRRGMCPGDIIGGLYRSNPDPRSRWDVAARLADEHGWQTVLAVPGIIHRTARSGREYLSLSGAPGLLIPVMDAAGLVVALRLRPDSAGDGGKYRWLSSRSSGGPRAVASCHVAGDLAGAPIVRVTEGELKAAIAHQRTGIPTISIPGVGSWQQAVAIVRAHCPDAAVRLALDADYQSNAAVASALAQLAVALPGTELETWDRCKGIDDALNAGEPVRVHDAAESLAIVAAAAEIDCPEPTTGPVRSLDDWRAEMLRARLQSIGRPGVYVDRSPTGAGKGHVERDAYRSVGRGVLIVPTHEHVQQELRRLRDDDIDATAYPELTDGNCSRYDAADAARSLGLPIVSTVCQCCPFSRACKANGYQGKLIAARTAEVQVMTHQRAALVGLREVSSGREYVSIHEDPVGVLRPTRTARDASLRPLADALGRMLDNPAFLSSRSADLDEQHRWCNLLLDETERLIEATAADHARPVEMERRPSVDVPPGGYWQLHHYLRHELRVAEQALSLVMGIVTGTLGRVTVRRRTVVGVRANQPATGVVTWICDATVDPGRLAELTGGDVQDRTPPGRLAYQQRVEQIPQDIRIRTAPATVQRIIRGWLGQHPEYQRVGIICHRGHVDAVDGLQTEFRRRIEMVEYWRGGADVGSNAWLGACDALLILGTPRLPPEAIGQHLVTVDQTAAAGLDGDWGDRRWLARTVSGAARVVRARGYRQPEWARAHRELVRARLIQAIGRGRGLLAEGLPVWVYSTEECGAPVADQAAPPRLSETAGHVLAELQNGQLSSSELADRLGISSRSIKGHLAELRRLGAAVSTGKGRATRWTSTVNGTTESGGKT